MTTTYSAPSCTYATTVLLGTLINFAVVALTITACVGFWESASNAVADVDGFVTMRVTDFGLTMYAKQFMTSTGSKPTARGDMDEYPDYWAPFRAAAAMLWLGFAFAAIAGVLGALQGCACVPAMGTRSIVLWTTALSFVCTLVGTAVGNYYMNDFRSSPSANVLVFNLGFTWRYGAACAIAATVLSFVNVAVVTVSGGAAPYPLPEGAAAAAAAHDDTKPIPMGSLDGVGPEAAMTIREDS